MAESSAGSDAAITQAAALGLYAGRPSEQKLVNSEALATLLDQRQLMLDALRELSCEGLLDCGCMRIAGGVLERLGEKP